MPTLFSASQNTFSRLLILHILNDKQCRSRSIGFRSQLVWIYIVCNAFWQITSKIQMICICQASFQNKNSTEGDVPLAGTSLYCKTGKTLSVLQLALYKGEGGGHPSCPLLPALCPSEAVLCLISIPDTKP